MKTIPFDIDKVKVGDVVVNRDGDEYRILARDSPCISLLHDREGLPIIAMDVRTGDILHYYINGRYFDDTETRSDLLIPVKTLEDKE